VWKRPFIYIASGAGVEPDSVFAGVYATALTKLNSTSAAVRYSLFLAEYTIIIFGSGTNPLVFAVETQLAFSEVLLRL
jgi:hypothetical protein